MDQLVNQQPYKRDKNDIKKFIWIFHADVYSYLVYRLFNLDSISLPDAKTLVIIAS